MRDTKRFAGSIRFIVPIIAMVSIAGGARAQEYTETPPPSQRSTWDDGRLYHANELSLDAFGVGVLHGYDFNSAGLSRNNYRWGGGAGINAFFTKYVGIGGDFYSTSWHNSFVDTTTGNLILRVPIDGTGLAPYIFGGAGYEFQGIDQVVGGGGVGLEFRPVPHFGIFVDARYLAAAKTDGFGIARAGIRLSF